MNTLPRSMSTVIRFPIMPLLPLPLKLKLGETIVGYVGTVDRFLSAYVAGWGANRWKLIAAAQEWYPH